MRLFGLSLAVFLFISCGEASENNLNSSDTATENYLIDFEKENNHPFDDKKQQSYRIGEGLDANLDEKTVVNKDISENVHNNLSNEKEVFSNNQGKEDNTLKAIKENSDSLNVNNNYINSTENKRNSGETKVSEEVESKNQSSNLHDDFNTFLKKYVSDDGLVDYKTIKKNASELDNYLTSLKSNPVKSSWSDDKQLAYWINAYNAFTIKRIIDNYPLNSIMDLDGGETWDVKWIKIGDKTYSLNQIEHEIIRPQFNDARIHFAVNCAAKSCPPLYNRAYSEKNVDNYLEKRTKQFINDKSFNQIVPMGAKVSKIFDWYKEDFGDLRAYINRYSTTKLNSAAKIDFKDYDWSLNGK